MRHLTAAQVAERIGFSIATLAAWRFKGVGPRFVKFGDKPQSRVRYPVDEVEAWEEAHPVHQNTGQAAA